MEAQLKPPMQPRNISEADTKRIAEFKEFITVGTDAEDMRKTLNGLYVNYTRLLVKHPDLIDDETDLELFYLSTLVEILE